MRFYLAAQIRAYPGFGQRLNLANQFDLTLLDAC
jgi:hypothetical protein